MDKKIKMHNIDNIQYTSQEPKELKAMSFDYIIISSDIYYTEIEQELLSMGIEKNKIRRRYFLLQALNYGENYYDNYTNTI